MEVYFRCSVFRSTNHGCKSLPRSPILPRQPKICNFDKPIFGNEYVFWFDILALGDYLLDGR
jgi:hypothetical protein